MDVARDVIELFSVKDPARARELANRLDQLNADRQEEERRILEAIYLRIEEDPELRDAFCMVIDGDGWHRGVIGITATRVVERYGRPTLIVSRNGDEAHGSGRSIPAFHLLDALESCAEMFSRFGGHAHAVGFSLLTSRVPDLRAQLDHYARTRLSLADFEPVLNFDDVLPLDQVTPELHQILQRLEPFGVGNPDPVFAAKAVRLLAPPRVLKDKHVKLKLAPARIASDGNSDWRKSLTLDALGWRMAERFQHAQLLPGDTLDIAFTVGQNDHPEFGGLELSLRDFKTPGKAKDENERATAAVDRA
jgi:single-stranded-DNA-specific exonuclease